VSAPTSSNPQPAPVTSVRQISPANPVLTQAELRAPVQQQQPIVAQQQQPTGVTQVQVGGPAAPQGGSPIAIQTPQAPQPPAQPQRHEPIVAEGNSGNAGSNLANSSLEEFARGIGEPVVPVGGNTADRDGNNQPAPPAPPKPTDAPTAGGQEYVAQAGDSLSRIASRLMGSNSKANREAIVKANPSLQKNPDVIIEGRKYVIPAANAVRVATATGNEARPAMPARPANGGTASSHKPVPVTDLVEPLPGTSPAAGGGDWYVVKDKDTLWQIAAEQLGTGTAWTQIRDMNQDVLKGRETVQANMRLRLPPRPVASAN
jgi:nucleoid-associated protein YgaU